jgi:hypothetical protein
MLSRPRRLRVRQKTPAAITAESVNKLRKLERYMNELAQTIRQREELQRDEEILLHAIGVELAANKIKAHETVDGIAAYEKKQSRSTRTINPKEYQELVSKEDFLESVKVSITKAKQFLSEREIEQISDSDRPVTTTEELIFKPASRKIRGRRKVVDTGK